VYPLVFDDQVFVMLIFVLLVRIWEYTIKGQISITAQIILNLNKFIFMLLNVLNLFLIKEGQVAPCISTKGAHRTVLGWIQLEAIVHSSNQLISACSLPQQKSS
jgi:hypothetical protein